MGAAGSVSAYLDTGEYLRAATNQETASLLGLNTTLAASVAIGVTALPVAASAGWAVGPLWLLDGPYSETVQALTAPDGVTLALAAPGATQAHAAGVSASQAGASGALAEVILRASAWAESYCRQGAPGSRSLFALPRVERWGLPGARAWREPDGGLTVRPAHFPAQNVTSLTVEAFPGASAAASAAVDVTQIELTASGSLIEIPAAALTSIALPPGGSPRRWVTLGYTGGVTPGAVSGELRQALVWVVSDFLAQRRNPSGAAAVRMGRFEFQARPRDDPSGDSILLLQAKAALQLWRVEW